MARQLASLLKGGVPLFQALTIIANQLEGDRTKQVVAYLRDEVKDGSSLSEALKAYPEIFDNLFVHSVAAGEKTGALDSILKYQADLFRDEQGAHKRVTQGGAMLPTQQQTNRNGFTLIELMIVIVIVGILATLLIPRIMERPEEARRIKGKMDIRTIESALKLCKIDSGVYPTTEQGLEALIRKPDTVPVPNKWREGGYLDGNTVPKDPWGKPAPTSLRRTMEGTMR